MTALRDPDLAAKFADGDPDVVRATYERYGRLVYAVYRSYSASAASPKKPPSRHSCPPGEPAPASIPPES